MKRPKGREWVRQAVTPDLQDAIAAFIADPPMISRAPGESEDDYKARARVCLTGLPVPGASQEKS